MPLRDRVGALSEREFRLLFSATTITSVGDRLAGIALAFAVLEFGGATDLGIVLGARSAVQAIVFVFGAVLSDRLPRNLVLVGASLTQGAAQAVTAALVLSGSPSIWSLILCQVVYGAGLGFVIPAEVGLVPQTVSPSRLQQANALQGLSRNIVGVVGPAIGGALVVAGSPGIALAADSVSFFACAALLARIRIQRRAAEARPGYFHELREGWREFTSHTWLWATIVVIGFSNMWYAGSTGVLGPTIARDDLGGAGAWALIISAGGLGAVAGGLFALRYRPSRPLLAAILATVPMVAPLVGLALLWPVWLIAAMSFLGASGLAVHLTLWFTVFQREIPEQAQSRVASYDALGSFVLIPLGMAMIGPVSAAIGVSTTLWLAIAIFLVADAICAALPSVWAIRAPELEPVPA
jgi:MFS family permease